METILDRIQELIELNNEKATPLMKKLGLSSSAFADWKRKNINPSTDAIIKIAQYFNVSTDYLLLGKTSSSKTLTEKEIQFIKLYSQLNELDQRECIGFMKGILYKEIKNNEE